ncbi:MV entry-fusion complex protein [Cotia virus SPAn232]|uniref:MV entry-fusion complex protein n=2 Tax=Cotia virus TaxID=39444 RepID=H6TA56_9POXV|nr:MV entry-fusion complex protein [Cotia virus SPAn232]ADT91096.1 MV entry-fusion complex protein [Cotia virus SPAn232]AIT70695.1 MV entry-fusion complex protein [Cotia virus]
MEKTNTFYFTPVFLEPTLKHSLLNIYKYTFIIVFEIFTVLILIFIFFKSEIKMLFFNDYINDSMFKTLMKTSLSCNGNNLVISGLPNKNNVNALYIDNKKPIIYDKCNEVLMSINGSHKIYLNDILRK